ncbi:hypothetical protein D4R75_11405 [bacterium]|nr:MAG: hypothetical protein D4R75_11405 [bacterium]
MNTILLTLLFQILWIACTYGQVHVALQINSSVSVHFIVTDPHGYRTGADPRGKHKDAAYGVTFIREISGANYAFTGLGPPESDSHEFVFNFDLPTDSGTYTIQVIGNKTAAFWLDLYVGTHEHMQDKSWSIDTAGAIQKDSVITFTLRVPPDTTSVPRLLKIVSSRTLLADIAAMYAVHSIKDRIKLKRYADLVRLYEQKMAMSDRADAVSTLRTLVDDIKADSGHGLARRDANLLIKDVEELLNHAPGSR